MVTAAVGRKKNAVLPAPSPAALIFRRPPWRTIVVPSTPNAIEPMGGLAFPPVLAGNGCAGAGLHLRAAKTEPTVCNQRVDYRRAPDFPRRGSKAEKAEFGRRQSHAAVGVGPPSACGGFVSFVGRFAAILLEFHESLAGHSIGNDIRP